MLCKGNYAQTWFVLLLDKGLNGRLQSKRMNVHIELSCSGSPAEVVEQAVDSLREAATYFSRLNCKERLRDIHYLQAKLHRSLGQTSQCNRSAMLFRLLDQELQTPAPPLSMRL